MIRPRTRQTTRRNRLGKSTLPKALGTRTAVTGHNTLHGASASQTPRLDLPWNVVAVDLGTETYSASQYTLAPGEPFDQSNISRIVMASERNSDLAGRTIAAWHDAENRWIMGKELEERLQEVPPQKIIRHFKLALYDAHQESLQVQRVHEQLQEADQTLHQLLSAFLRYIWEDVWKYINEELLRHKHKPAPSETLVYITVPMLVTPNAIEQLKDAAKEAGIPNVQCLHEPLCAGSSVLEEIIRKGMLNVPDNCTGLVLDCGGGTTDAVLVKLSPSREGASHQMLQVVGQPEGILCGSSSIDASFQQWMLKDWPSPGGFAKAVTKLHLTKEYVLQKATILFQDHKNDFPRPPGGGYKDIYIRPAKGMGREVSLDYERLESFFEPHVRAITALARKLIREDTKFIFLTGGLSANAYFCRKMRDEFASLEVVPPMQDWSQCPVARGAQLMEHTLDITQIPSLYALGVVFDNEPFDKKIHKDVLDDHGNPRDKLIFEDFWYSRRTKKPQYVVQDRIMWLLKQRETAASHTGWYESEKLPLQFHIQKEHPTLSVTIVFTRKTDIHDHEPLYTLQGDVEQGFEKDEKTFNLCDLSPEMVSDLERNGWTQWLSPGKDDQKRPLPKTLHLEFWCRVSLRHDNKSIEVGLEVLDPNKIKFAKGRKLSEQDLMGPSMEANWVQIWNADTHVLKSSLPAPTANLSRSNRSVPEVRGALNSRSTRMTGYEADDEATRVRVSRMLEDELQDSMENLDGARRLALANAAQQALAVGVAPGEKRKANETYSSSSKRANPGPRGPRQMTAPDVNSRASLSPSLVTYEGPSWSYGQN